MFIYSTICRRTLLPLDMVPSYCPCYYFFTASSSLRSLKWKFYAEISFCLLSFDHAGKSGLLLIPMFQNPVVNQGWAGVKCLMLGLWRTFHNFQEQFLWPIKEGAEKTPAPVSFNTHLKKKTALFL